MRKLVLIICLFLSGNSVAQNWIEQNAVWHYSFDGYGGFGFTRLNYTSDTLIQGYNCQKINARFYHFLTDMSNISFLNSTYDYPPKFTYNSGDTVFYLENNVFRVLYNFEAEVGDEWLLSVDTNTYFENDSCSDSSYQRVLYVGDTLLAGRTRKYYRVDNLSSDGKMFQKGDVVEGIGILPYLNNPFHEAGNFLFPVYIYCGEDFPSHPLSQKFRCFQDDSTFFNPSGVECEYELNHVGLSELSNSSFQLYPNPASDIVTINSQQSGDYFITDALGRIVSTGKITADQSLEISTLAFSKGMYSVIIVPENKQKGIQKLVIK